MTIHFEYAPRLSRTTSIALALFLLCGSAIASQPIVPVSADDVPEVLRGKISGILSKCILNEQSGNLEPTFYRYQQTAELSHYVIDFSPFKEETAANPDCPLKEPLCGEGGCAIIAFTATRPNEWDMSFDGAAMGITFDNTIHHGTSLPTVTLLTAPSKCTMNSPVGCQVQFGWPEGHFEAFPETAIPGAPEVPEPPQEVPEPPQ